MESNGQDIKDYLRLIQKKKGLFFAVAASIMAAFILASYMLPKIYEAKCTVIIVNSVYKDYVKDIAITQAVDESMSGLSFALKSKRLILKVIKDFGFVTDTVSPEKEEALVKRFQKGLVVSIQSNRVNPRMTDNFVVSYRDKNPELARDYVNALVRRYIEEDYAGKKEDTAEARMLLSGQVRLFKDKMNAIEAEIARFSTGENVYAYADEAKINEKLVPLQNRLGQLTVTYTDDYPEVAATKAEIKRLQEQLKYSRNSGGEKNTPSAAKNEQGSTAEGSSKKMLDLERERDTYKKIYEELVLRLSKSEVSLQMGPADKAEMFSITEPAVLPTKPVSPDRVKVILMGILAGLAGGIGIIVLLDLTDHSVKSAKEVKAFGLPVLAIIPKIQSDRQLLRERVLNNIFYCIVGLYMLCVLAVVAIEALDLPYADTFAQQSLVAIKTTVKSIF